MIIFLLNMSNEFSDYLWNAVEIVVALELQLSYIKDPLNQRSVQDLNLGPLSQNEVQGSNTKQAKTISCLRLYGMKRKN